MAPIICTFIFLLIYIFAAAWLCHVLMKPVSARFESDFSIPDSVDRLSMICLPFNFSHQAIQWVFGSVSAGKVELECRTKGVKRSWSQFTGKFVLDADKVELVGKFEMAPGAKMTLIFWITILGASLIVVAKILILDCNQGMLGLFIFICFMLSFVIWVTKIRISEYPDEVKFISARIKQVLQKI